MLLLLGSGIPNNRWTGEGLTDLTANRNNKEYRPGFEAAMQGQACWQWPGGLASNPVRAIQQSSAAEQGWMIIPISNIHDPVGHIFADNVAPAFCTNRVAL